MDEIFGTRRAISETTTKKSAIYVWGYNESGQTGRKGKQWQLSIPRLWILGKVAQKLLPTGEFFFFFLFIRRLNLNDLSHAILWLPCWNPEHLLLCHPTVVINQTSQLQQCFLLNLWKTMWKCLCSRSNLLVLDKEDEKNCTLFFAIMCDKLRQCQNIVAFARELQVL